MSEPYYVAVTWPDGSYLDAVRDSRSEAEAWLRETAVPDEPMATVLIPQRQRTETQQVAQDRLAALRAPNSPDWAGPLHAARVLCAADRRDHPKLVDRRLDELDVAAELVEIALAARIVTTAQHYSLGAREALALGFDDVRWHEGDPLDTATPETVAAEVNELRRRAHADPSWWASLWRHVDAILHGQLLAGLGGDARARTPSIIERLEAIAGREHG